MHLFSTEPNLESYLLACTKKLLVICEGLRLSISLRGAVFHKVDPPVTRMASNVTLVHFVTVQKISTGWV